MWWLNNGQAYYLFTYCYFLFLFFFFFVGREGRATYQILVFFFFPLLNFDGFSVFSRSSFFFFPTFLFPEYLVVFIPAPRWIVRRRVNSYRAFRISRWDLSPKKKKKIEKNALTKWRNTDNNNSKKEKKKRVLAYVGNCINSVRDKEGENNNNNNNIFLREHNFFFSFFLFFFLLPLSGVCYCIAFSRWRRLPTPSMAQWLIHEGREKKKKEGKLLRTSCFSSCLTNVEEKEKKKKKAPEKCMCY